MSLSTTNKRRRQLLTHQRPYYFAEKIYIVELLFQSIYK